MKPACRLAWILSVVACLVPAQQPPSAAPQKLDEAYTAKIREFTTSPQFLTELVDHLPASDRVPTPEKFHGYIAGAPDRLTYAKDVARYLAELARTSPRVRFTTIGQTEEGRDMVLAIVSDEANLAKLDRYREITARLADPRKTNDAEAAQLISEALPIYWLTGAIHSPETGSPEMLMELAYRLAVEESPFIQNIRKNAIVMITPVIEVDGRERQVDVYRYRKANPNKPAPNLVYWGKYVAHDNNRDAMGLGLALSRNVTKTFFDYHPQVLHDLHESVPFLYISTGMGPYNAWLDPIVINEWQRMAYNEVQELTKRGVPGVWTHGFYDGWAANYMFMAAQGHNSIGRFYETFGNGGADTRERTVNASQTSRAWFRPNPPLPKVKWSQRNNVNLQQSGVLLALDYVARNKSEFLNNFYAKSKRSVAKAVTEGPAAWVIPADDPRPSEAADLLNLLALQGVEVHRADKEFEVTAKPGGSPAKFPAGSWVIRMDQPYSRMADMLLDTQFYNVNDPAPYDDTGWTLGALRNVKTVRVTDPAVLKASMTESKAPFAVQGKLDGAATAAAYLIPHNSANALATLRFQLKDVKMNAAEEPFNSGGRTFSAGSFVIPIDGNPSDLRTRLDRAALPLGLTIIAAAESPKVKTHPLAVPRIALVHSWLNTQNEGWYRMAFDRHKIPYDYISDQTIARTPDLRARWDVILFGPTPGNSQRVVNGLQAREAIPWQKSELTPNFDNSPDQTPDMRGGMGLEGLVNVRKFVEQGGLFITIGSNSSIPIDFGLVDGVSIQQTRDLRVRGSVVNARLTDRGSPVTYGYGDVLPVYFNQAPVFAVSLTGGLMGGGGGGANAGGEAQQRASGRGSPADPDVIQGRAYEPPPPRPEVRPGEDPPLAEDIMDQIRAFLPAPDQRPRIVARFADERDLLVSGMLSGGRELAGHPAIIDIPKQKGHYLFFANNPMWRNQTQGSHFLLFNAMLNFDNLGAGRSPAAPAPKPSDPRPSNDQ